MHLLQTMVTHGATRESCCGSICMHSFNHAQLQPQSGDPPAHERVSKPHHSPLIMELPRFGGMMERVAGVWCSELVMGNLRCGRRAV